MFTQQRIADPFAFIHFENVFSAEECDRIIGIAKAIGTSVARHGNVNQAEPDPKIRKAWLTWLHPQESTQWVFNKLLQCASDTHMGWFPCECDAVQNEAIQITHYPANVNAHYSWHMDYGAGSMRNRKMSLVANLSPPESYDGGRLEIAWAPETEIAPNNRGSVVTFPSYALHRVRPVTSGERWSLVWWLSGSMPWR